MIRAIAFDCFGVLLSDYSHNWVDTSGLADDVQAQIHELFRQRDLGELEGDTYYTEVGKLAGIDPMILRAKEHHVGQLEPMLLDYIKSRLVGHYELYIASNSSASLLTELLTKEGFTGLFSHTFVSSEMGVIKPEPSFYNQMLHRVDLPAGEILFVDDRLPNVDAAIAAGMQGHHYTNFAEFKNYFESLT